MAILPAARIRTARTLAGYEGRGVLNPQGQRQATAGSLSTLTEARWPIQTPRIARTYAYDGAYLYRPGAIALPDRVRLIAAAGLNSQTGTFTPDADWTAAPAVDEPYEVHSHGIDPAQEMVDLFNTALKMIYLLVDVAFVPATDSRGAYIPATDVAGNALAAWLVDEAQLLRLRTTAAYAGLSGALNAPAMWGGDLRGGAQRNGNRLYLTASYGLFPTATIYATVKAPAFWLCRANPTDVFGAAAGLTAYVEASEAPVDEDWLVDGALVAAWERAPYALETAAQRRRDTYLQEASLRFQQRQAAYWQANPPQRTFVAAPQQLVGRHVL